MPIACHSGVTLPPSDKFWNDYYPPNGWKCRCYVVPKMAAEVSVSEQSQHEIAERYMETADWKNAEAQHWNINRAKQGLVFDANQMYIRKFPNNAATYMDKVRPGQWGLENSIKKLQQQATETAAVYNGTAEEFWEAHKQLVDGKEFLVVKDYNGREWKMDRRIFDAHTSNIIKKRAFRTKYLDNIFDVAQHPDEVWLGRTSDDIGNDIKVLENYILIKHYHNQSIAVVFNSNGNDMIFKTWYPVNDKKVRSGLLLKRKKQ